MLEFKKTGNGFEIIERILGFSSTQVNTVRYNHDISKCKVNNDPWHDTCQGQREWFEKYYRKKF